MGSELSPAKCSVFGLYALDLCFRRIGPIWLYLHIGAAALMATSVSHLRHIRSTAPVRSGDVLCDHQFLEALTRKRWPPAFRNGLSREGLSAVVVIGHSHIMNAGDTCQANDISRTGRGGA